MKSGTTVVPVGSCQQALDNVQSHCPIRNSIPPSLRRKNIRREYIKDKNKARNWTGSPFQYQTDYWDLLFWYSFIFISPVSTVIFTKSETAMLSTGKVTKIQRYCFIWNTIEQLWVQTKFLGMQINLNRFNDEDLETQTSDIKKSSFSTQPHACV